MSESSVYVRGDNKSNYEGMTREQIYTAIIQAIETGVISDIDAGIITKIKELNKNAQLRFWVGTSAEYNQIEEPETNVLYIKTDDTSAADISAQLAALAQQITGVADELTTVEGNLQALYSRYIEFSSITSQRLTELEGKIYIPVGGVFISGDTITTAEQVAEATGFGTWQAHGTITAGANTINCWLRTE